MTLCLVLPLVLIPNLKAHASAYSAETDFTYNYQGYNYKFFVTQGSYESLPSGYSFDPDVLEYVMNKTADALQCQYSFAPLGIKIEEFYNNALSSVFGLLNNAYVAINQFTQDYISQNSGIAAWDYYFTGSNDGYPGYETYGTAYGFRFEHTIGSGYIDIVLDANGDFYGSNPIANYTFEDISEELDWISIHQIDGDDIWLTPSESSNNVGNLPAPYIDGKELHFFGYYNGAQHHFIVSDFRNLNIGLMGNNSQMCSLVFYSAKGQNISNSVVKLYDNNTIVQTYNFTITFADWRNLNPSTNQCLSILTDAYRNVIFNLPGYYTTGSYFQQNNVIGFNGDQPVYGFGDIFLLTSDFTPVSDPVVAPIDVPFPISDIPSDPTDFEPTPSDDPDDIPGIEYPTPTPPPIVVPDVPSIISGNDDLWPDLNDYFETEDDIIDFTFPAVNVEFPDLSILLGNFVNSFTWVSTIITALFNGSDFSVLFSVLAFFFIAAAVLGIYKWWK